MITLHSLRVTPVDHFRSGQWKWKCESHFFRTQSGQVARFTSKQKTKMTPRRPALPLGTKYK